MSAYMTASRDWVLEQLQTVRSELQAAVSGQGSALVAGSGVTIEGNVISATVDLSQVNSRIDALAAEIATKQSALSAGDGIVIAGGVVSAVAADLSAVEAEIAALRAAVAAKQSALSAGTGISISAGVVSALPPDLSAYARTADLDLLRQAVAASVSAKQDALVAGAGIAILNGVISCTADQAPDVNRAYVDGKVAELEAAVRARQAALTAGPGISIRDGVISASGADLSGYARSSEVATAVAALEAAVAGRQAALTAGSGISIVGNVISATGQGGISQDYLDRQIADLAEAIAQKASAVTYGDMFSYDQDGRLVVAMPDLSGYATAASLAAEIEAVSREVSDTYQRRLVAGLGIEIDGDDRISVVPDEFLSGYARTEYVDAAVREVAETAAGKQDRLTAGANVVIEGSVIRAIMPDLAGYVTVKELNSAVTTLTLALGSYQKELTAGAGIVISQGGVVSCTLDLSQYALSSSVESALAQVRSSVALKQDSLVAGSGISITGNVISASSAVAEYVSQSGTAAVSGRAVYDYLSDNYVRTSALQSALDAYVRASDLGSYATQAYVLQQLASYAKSSDLQNAVASIPSDDRIRSIVTGYGYATTTSLSALQSSLESYVQSAVANAQAGMTYKGSVETLDDIPAEGIRSGDMYWVEDLGSGTGGFRIVDGSGSWATISIGGGTGTSGVSSSLFTAHASNQNAEKHVTAAHLTLLDSLSSKVSQYDSHIASTVFHVTATERSTWNAAVAALASHEADDDAHVSAADRARWNAIASGSGGTFELDSALDPDSHNAVENAAIATALAAKADAAATDVDLRLACDFCGEPGHYVVDADGTVVGVVTSAITTSGSEAVGASLAPPLSRLDVVLFRRGVFADGPARHGTSSVFDDLSGKIPSSGASGLSRRTYGGADDPNAVVLSFRTGADASRYSATRYPLADSATQGRHWDLVTCNLTTGALTLLVGGNSSAHPTLETHQLRWKGTLGNSATVPVRMSSGARILGLQDIDQEPVEGHFATPVSSHALAVALAGGAGGGPGSSVTVDSELSADSANPVENRAIKAALDSKLEALTYRRVDLVTVASGTVSYSENFQSSPYAGGTALRIDGLASQAGLVSGTFAASLAFAYDRDSGRFTTKTLTVTDGSAVAAASPNPNARAADYQKAVTMTGASVDCGGIYVYPMTSKIVKDRVRCLAVGDGTYPAGTFVFESVNYNDESDSTVFAYLNPQTFPQETSIVPGRCSGELSEDPDLMAADRLVSSAGIARALAGKLDASALVAPDVDKVAASAAVKVEGGAYANLGAGGWKLVSAADAGVPLSTSAQMSYDAATREIESATFQVSAFTILTGQGTGQFAAKSYSFSASGSYPQRSVNLAASGGSVNTGVVIGSTTATFRKHRKTIGTSGTTYTAVGSAGTVTADAVFFPSATPDFAAGTLLFVTDDASTALVSPAIDNIVSTTSTTGTSTAYPYAMLRTRLVPNSTAGADSLRIVAVDQRPNPEHRDRLVTSAGVAAYVADSVNGDAVALGRAQGVGSLTFHGFELLDPSGHIPSGRIHLGYSVSVPADVGMTGIPTTGFSIFWNGRYYVTNGSASFKKYAASGGSLVESSVDGTNGNPGTALYSSANGASFAKVDGLPTMKYICDLSAGRTMICVSGVGEDDKAVIYTSLDGVTWRKGVFASDPNARRLWRVIYDDDHGVYLVQGAGNSGNPNGESQYFYVSTDGVNWTEKTLGSSSDPDYECEMAYLGSYFFASVRRKSGTSYTPVLLRSVDGNTWTVCKSFGSEAVNDHIHSIAFGAGRYVFASAYSTSVGQGIWYSDDAVNWSKATVVGGVNPGVQAGGLYYFNGVWIANGNSSTGMLVSLDNAATWHEVRIGGKERITGGTPASSGIISTRVFTETEGVLFLPLASGGLAYTSDGISWLKIETSAVFNDLFVRGDGSLGLISPNNRQYSTSVSKITFDSLLRGSLAQMLSFDTVPTAGSVKAVTSGGLKVYFDGLISQLRGEIATINSTIESAFDAILTA